MKKSHWLSHVINMNWEKIEEEFIKWVAEDPDRRMCSFRCFLNWLKQNYEPLSIEKSN